MEFRESRLKLRIGKNFDLVLVTGEEYLDQPLISIKIFAKDLFVYFVECRFHQDDLKCIWTENSFYAVINFHLWNTPFRSLRRLGWKLAMLQAFKVTLFALKNGLQIARPKGQNVTWCDVILVARSVQYLVWRFFSTYFNFLLVPWSLSNRSTSFNLRSGKNSLNVTESKQTFATKITSQLDPSPLNFVTIF